MAIRILGRVEGQSTRAGVYPLGAWFVARFQDSKFEDSALLLMADAGYELVSYDARPGGTRQCRGGNDVQLAKHVRVEAVSKLETFILD